MAETRERLGELQRVAPGPAPPDAPLPLSVVGEFNKAHKLLPLADRLGCSRQTETTKRQQGR
jgi:hypothetical protein